MAKCTTVGLPTSPASLSRWGLNLILLLGSCVVAFAVAEIALRIVRPVSTVAYRLDADLGYRLGGIKKLAR